MKELGRITVTVTRIEYGFDESEFREKGVNAHAIQGERTVVEIDGDIYYDKYISGHLILKHPTIGSPVDCFWDYITQLGSAHKPQCCSDIGCYRCKFFYFLRKRRLKAFNLKKQLINVRLKKFFLHLKSPFRKKLGGLKKQMK